MAAREAVGLHAEQALAEGAEEQERDALSHAAATWAAQPEGFFGNGWLMKKGGIRKNWQRRYFVLRRPEDSDGAMAWDYRLDYYADEQKQEHKGSVPLHPMPGAHDGGYTHEHAKVSTAPNCEPFDIEVTTVVCKAGAATWSPGRTYQLRAANAEEQQFWIQLINRVGGHAGNFLDSCGSKQLRSHGAEWWGWY